MKKDLDSYFKQAQSWADDQFGKMEQSRNRYQLAFLSAMAINGLALISIAILSHYQTIVPLLVHHYEHGVTTVEAIKNSDIPRNRTQVESDIARYIESRESYEESSYRTQFDLVHLLSNRNVGKEYLQEQDPSNPKSPLHLLANHSKREVHIYSINFLDAWLSNEKEIHKDHQNLAEVVLSLIDTDKTSGKATTTYYNAMVSWRYISPPDSPEARWKNWDGFEVIRYSKQPRMMEQER